MGSDERIVAWAAEWLNEHYGDRRTFTQAEGARMRGEMFQGLPVELFPCPAVTQAELRAVLHRQEGFPDDSDVA